MSLLKWLGFEGAREEPDPDPVANIERALGGLDPHRARHLACFAYILTRAARADHEITEDEEREMERLLALRADISLEQAAPIIRIARAEAARSAGTDDFLVTREFDGLATHEQKLALLECLFAVSSADDSIITAEDNEVRRIANELKIEHAEFIAVRAGHLDKLHVLKKDG